MWILKNKSDRARLGCLSLQHGDMDTPLFMPVGTLANVKTLVPEEIEAIGYELILANTYHLNIRPGIDIIQSLGGLHSFMNWKKGILTDSGGFQIFSLAPFRKIQEDGVTFRSHTDGKIHFLSPENVIDKQEAMGVDIAMVLDVCPPADAPIDLVKKSIKTTSQWADRSLKHWRSHYDSQMKIFGILQGGMFPDLRTISAETLVPLDFHGYAIGGLSVGEEKSLMYEMIDVSTDLLPENKVRYLMGVGHPLDLLEGVSRGVDIFDCVFPCRNARHGSLFTSTGSIKIKKKEWRADSQPIDENCSCYTCQKFSKAYLRHLFQSKELLGLRLATIHNLTFLYDLMKNIRIAIKNKRFKEFKEKFISQWKS